MADRFGYDLGTTNSVLATYKAGVRFLRNRQGEVLTPSWATWHDGNWVVGKRARDISVLAPECSVFSAKRLMGRNFSDPKVQQALKVLPYKIKPAASGGEGLLIEIDGKDYEPQDIGAMVLRQMKEEAEEMHPGITVDEVVITVPAYFNESQNAATMEAGTRAGLTVLSLLPEPSASALAYGADPEKHDGRVILVYDLGGGTFDVTIIMISVGNFITQGLDGDMWLGGDDFDECVVRFIVDHIKKTCKKDPTGDPSSMMDIRKAAQKAKENLSDMPSTDVSLVLPQLGNAYVQMKILRRPKCPDCREWCKVSTRAAGEDEAGRPKYEAIATCQNSKCPKCGTELRGEVVTSTFEGAIAPMVQATIDMTDRALEKAGNTAEDLDEVLMVGGSTFVPLVRDAVREKFGPDKVRFEVDPMQCVAQGAAIYAAQVPHRVKCPRCGKLNELRAGECDGQIDGKPCGFRFPKKDVEEARARTIECPNCGHAIPAGAEKCPKCGLPLGDFVGTTAQAYGVGLVGGGYGIVIPAQSNYPMIDNEGKLNGVTQTFYTVSDNQKLVDVPVYFGDNVEDVTQNDLMGHVIVTLPDPVPQRTPVDVTFALDRSQLLEVTVVVRDAKGSRARAVFQGAGSPTTDAKGMLDRAAEIRQRAGSRLGPDLEARLAQLEARVLELAGNETISSSRKRDEIAAEKEELERMARDLGVEEERPEWVGEAIGSINWANLAVLKIGDLLDPDVATELPKLAQALERAVELKDKENAEKLTARIDHIIHDLDRTAAMAFQAYCLTFRVQQHNPAQAEEFRSRLDRLVPRLAQGSFEAEEELVRLFAEIRKALPTTDPEPGVGPGLKDGITRDKGVDDVFLS